MNMVELHTVDPMIAAGHEREYLLERVRALEQIILDQSAFNVDVEFARFCNHAKSKYRAQLERGWDQERCRFRHGNLHKRWEGWLLCAQARQVTR